MAFLFHRSFNRRFGRAVLVFAIFAVSICLTCSATTTSAHPRAQASGTAVASSRLDAVEVTGSTRFHSEQIAPTTGLQPGSNVTREDIQGGADRLAKLGLFTGVQYRFSSAESGVKVSYQVADVPVLPVAFDNFPWFSDDEIKAALKDSVALFDGSAPARGSILDDMSSALAKLLETRNVHGTVSHSLETDSDGEQIQRFRVEGTELKVGSVEFSDALASSDRALQTRVSDIVGKPFSRSALETFELEQVKPVYLERGFLRVQFERPNAHLAGNPESALPNKVIVVAPVTPGPAYSWNGVVWLGNSAVSTQDLNSFAKLKAGDLADGMKIEAMWEDVRNAYSKRGFLDATLKPIPEFDDASKKVSYSVSITEGPQYKMGDLVLTGLSPEGEKRIRNAWKIPSGSIFDKTFYDQFIDTGIKQAFTGMSYHYDKIGRFLQQDPKAGKVDVLLDFQ